jgi:hypothetical protein
MTRKSMRDFGADTAMVTAAFFVRNAFVLVGLSIVTVLALVR